MIEMLGVLAVVAVLSIGGLLGYRRAVNNHHANQILDDANRFAFVILESNQAFEPYANIEGLDFTQTSPYFLNAFTEATSQQFAIMVTNVPKGVCEALLPKAAAQYKVRTLKANTIQEIAQVSPNSILYDEQNTDICNDTNDVVLYFGDVSKQCTPAAGKDCTSNADCCYGEFCWSPNDDCEETGLSRCEEITKTNFPPITETMSDGKTWTHSNQGMNWWSAQNWCKAQGKKPADHTDIDCVGVDKWDGIYCISDTFKAIQSVWNKGNHWLEDAGGDSCRAYHVYFNTGEVPSTSRANYDYALCH